MGVCENLVDTCNIQDKLMAQHYLTLCESPEGLFWGGFPRLPPGKLLHPGIEPVTFPALAGRFFVCLFVFYWLLKHLYLIQISAEMDKCYNI